ncbi:MAG: oligopeptide:H+ symporter, partial [Acidobacteriota bacterium]
MNASEAPKDWFGHPRGLSTLFFTEVWERFSYYGMRPLLILYITAVAAEGGLGMDEQTGGAIVGLYAFGVYALALPGGWIADRLIGKKKAVLWGGIIIALGHFSLAIPALWAFYTGLLLVVIGTGLLKPNVSVVVGDLYEGDTGARRDAGFSIFYTGINIGAFLGPLVCGYLFEIDPHLGFGAAGVGMVIGVIQYILGQKHLDGAGDLREEAATPELLADARKKLFLGLGVVAFLTLALVGANAAGLPITLVRFAQSTGLIVTVLALVYFASVIAFACNDQIERRRIGLCAVLFVGAAMFWSGFEQASTSLN